MKSYNFDTSIFLIKPTWPKSQDKIQMSWEQVELLRWNKRHFSSFLKGFQISKIVSDLECTFKAKAISSLTFSFFKFFSDTKTYFKSSHRSCSIKKAVPKTFEMFTGKHLCWSLFLIKLKAFRTVARQAHLRFYFSLGKILKYFINSQTVFF